MNPSDHPDLSQRQQTARVRLSQSQSRSSEPKSQDSALNSASTHRREPRKNSFRCAYDGFNSEDQTEIDSMDKVFREYDPDSDKENRPSSDIDGDSDSFSDSDSFDSSIEGEEATLMRRYGIGEHTKVCQMVKKNGIWTIEEVTEPSGTNRTSFLKDWFEQREKKRTSQNDSSLSLSTRQTSAGHQLNKQNLSQPVHNQTSGGKEPTRDSKSQPVDTNQSVFGETDEPNLVSAFPRRPRCSKMSQLEEKLRSLEPKGRRQKGHFHDDFLDF